MPPTALTSSDDFVGRIVTDHAPQPAPSAEVPWPGYRFAPRQPRGPFRRRRLKAHGSRVLLWTIALYAMAQIAVVAVKDRWLALGPYQESRKWPRLRELAHDAQTPPLAIMVGSSRVSWAFQAGRLNGLPGPEGKPLRFYNFGIPATGVIHALLNVRDMLSEGIHPDVLLVEFLPPLLCEPHGTWPSEERFAASPWMSAREMVRLNPYLSRHGHQKVREWCESRTVSWYAYRNQLMDEFCHLALGKVLPRQLDVDDWGACLLPPEASAEKRAKDTEEALQFYGPSLETYRVGQGPTRAFHELLTLCCREKIRVMLVHMPESSDFRKLYSTNATAKSRALIEDYVREFGVDVIDASTWVADADFADGHHTLAAGAERFTNRLGVELKRIFAAPAANSRAAGPAESGKDG
jgi:hypothetical protein